MSLRLLRGGVPLFTELPRRVLLGNSEACEGIKKRAEAIRHRLFV